MDIEINVRITGSKKNDGTIVDLKVYVVEPRVESDPNYPIWPHLRELDEIGDENEKRWAVYEHTAGSDEPGAAIDLIYQDSHDYEDDEDNGGT